MTLEDQCAQDLAESNHGHEDFQSTSFRKRFPIVFKYLDIKHLQDPCWNSLGYLGLFSVRRLHFGYTVLPTGGMYQSSPTPIQ